MDRCRGTAQPATACTGDCAACGVPASVGAMTTPDTRELVVLAHGMGRTPVSMWWLARSLEARGYRVLNWGYSSYRHPVEALGARLGDAVRSAERSATR